MIQQNDRCQCEQKQSVTLKLAHHYHIHHWAHRLPLRLYWAT